MSEKFPDTPEGRQAAINATSAMDWWEERIDYSGVHIESGDHALAVVAIALAARERPELFTNEQHGMITNIVNELKGKQHE